MINQDGYILFKALLNRYEVFAFITIEVRFIEISDLVMIKGFKLVFEECLSNRG